MRYVYLKMLARDESLSPFGDTS